MGGDCSHYCAMPAPQSLILEVSFGFVRKEVKKAVILCWRSRLISNEKIKTNAGVTPRLVFSLRIPVSFHIGVRPEGRLERISSGDFISLEL